MKATWIEGLAAFASETGPAPVALAKARACLLFGSAVAVASARAPAATIVARAQDRQGIAAGSARRWLDGASLPIGEAALANAVLAHARIQEDAHPAGHVGVVVLPAAVAAAEATGASGTALLEAIVVGYEVALRLGRDHAADISRRGFRTTSVYGPAGAAAAAGRLLGLGPPAMANALALAAGMGSGLRAFVTAGSSEYAVQAGIAARDGIAAAALAAEGQDAARDVLETPAGFFAAYGGQPSEAGRRLLDGLGEDYEMLRVTYKPYPVCQFHRDVVHGLATLREQAEGRPPTSIEVAMHPFEADFLGVRHAGPYASFPQTFMSVPFLASLAWHDGGASHARLHDFQAAEILELVPRVRVTAEPDRPRYTPRITVRFTDHPPLEWEARAGEAAWNLDPTAAAAMATRLGEECGVGEAPMRELAEIVGTLASAGSCRPLVDRICALLAAAGAPGVATRPGRRRAIRARPEVNTGATPPS